MEENNLQKYVDIVESNINGNLEVITSIVYDYDIKGIIEGLNDLSKQEQDIVLEKCINNYLIRIKNSSLNQKIYKKMERDLDEIMDFYDENTNLQEVMEEASTVSYDLVMKVIGYNDRNIELPINIDFIKSFCIHNMIKEEDIKYTILFIVLTLASICHCLDNKKYDENNEVEQYN